MKLNSCTAISTPKVLLVPYDARHVPRYHEWMKDDEIQDLTASEPLTLEEEYENQLSWRNSHDKLTFIICQPLNLNPSSEGRMRDVKGGIDDGDDKMLGDVNFFIYPCDDQEPDPNPSHPDDSAQATVPCFGEVDVMIAERADRGMGRGFAAVCALLLYVRRNLEGMLGEYVLSEGGLANRRTVGVKLTRLVAKIKERNERSRVLFRRLGFKQRGEVNYFGEVEMVLEDFEGFVGDGRWGWWGELEEEYEEVRYVRE